MRGPREAAVREVDALGGDGGQPCHSEKYQCDFLDVFHVDVSLSASCRRRRVYHNSRPNEALKTQIFREVYAYTSGPLFSQTYTSHILAVSLAASVPCSAQRYRNQKRAQIPKLKDVQRLRGNVAVNVVPQPGVELSETLPP